MKKLSSSFKLNQNNKGFTLVELIIVVAIIAILATLLVPQYLQYVENSRIVTDVSAADTVERALNVLIADGTISGAGTITWDTASGDITLATFTNAVAVATDLATILDVDAPTGTDPTFDFLVAASNIAREGDGSDDFDPDVVWTVSYADGIPSIEVSGNDYNTWLSN